MMKDNLYTDSILCGDRQDHYDSRLDLAIIVNVIFCYIKYNIINVVDNIVYSKRTIILDH